MFHYVAMAQLNYLFSFFFFSSLPEMTFEGNEFRFFRSGEVLKIYIVNSLGNAWRLAHDFIKSRNLDCEILIYRMCFDSTKE